MEGSAPSIIDNLDARFLGDILVTDPIIAKGEERINRSMRWLQHSYFSSTPIDEFISLMLAFEAISHLLKQPEPRYWYCSSCKKDVVECPECGASTEWAGSGSLAMRDFVCGRLAWPQKKWKTIWKLRNLIFHGSQELSAIQQQTIFTHLGDLEDSVLSALKILLKLPENSPPKTLRQRGMFYGASLHTKWKQNG